MVIDPLHPSTLYVATTRDQRSLWKTTNRGDRWSRADAGLPLADGYVTALAIDPASSDTLFAGTDSAGVFRSRDGGASWEPAGSGLPDAGVQAIAVAPSDHLTVYAWLDGRGWRSRDGGDHWARVGSFDLAITSLAVDPTNPDVVFAGSYVGGVFRTADGGASWTGLLRGRGDNPVQSIQLDPSRPSTIYVSRGRTGVAETTDGGATWAKKNSGIYGGWFTSLVISPSDPSVLYVAQASDESGRHVFRSADGGESWRAAGPVDQSISTLAVDPNDPDTVFAGGNSFFQVGGVWRSVDGGHHWRHASDGLTGGFVSTVDVDPTRPGVVYAGTSSIGAYRSWSGGWSWHAMAPGRLTGDEIEIEVAVDPNDPDTVYAGRFGCCVAPGGFFRSVDRGRTWRQYTTGLPGGVPEVRSIAGVPGAPGRVYAAVGDGSRRELYWSTDGGATWEPRESGLPFLQLDAPIAVDPVNPDVAWAGTCSGLYRTTDAGASWSPVGFDRRCVDALEVAPSDGDVIYVALGNGSHRIYRTVDGGDHWADLTEGLRRGYANSLAVDRTHPLRLYAANQSGVFSWTGAGGWVDVGSLAGYLVLDMAIDTAGTLYATTTQSGVWYIATQPAP